MRGIKLFLLATIIAIGFLLLLCFFILTEYSQPCKPFKANLLKQEINFLISIREAIPKYNLNYRNHIAFSNLNKDTIMLVVTSDDYTRKLMRDYYPDSLDHPIYGFLWYLKNPSENAIVGIKEKIEKQFGKKFEKRKFRFYESKPWYYYHMKINDCVQITLKPDGNLTLLNDYWNIKSNAVKACIIGVYYNLSEDDVDSATLTGGIYGRD